MDIRKLPFAGSPLFLEELVRSVPGNFAKYPREGRPLKWIAIVLVFLGMMMSTLGSFASHGLILFSMMQDDSPIGSHVLHLHQSPVDDDHVDDSSSVAEKEQKSTQHSANDHSHETPYPFVVPIWRHRALLFAHYAIASRHHYDLAADRLERPPKFWV